MIVPIAMAYMSCLAPAGQEGRYMSYLNIAMFCGIGCGPIIGGLFSDLFGLASVFYVMAFLSFLAFILVIMTMPSQAPSGSSNGFSLFKNISLMFQNRRILGILTARFSTMIVMVPSMAFLPLLMTERMSVSGLQIGSVIACRTLVNAVLQVPAGKFADTHNKLLLLAAGCVCLSGSILFIPFVERFVVMIILYIMIGIGESIIWPVLGAYASLEGKQYGHGTMMGVFSLAMSGGVFTGATLAGFSMDGWGIDWAYFTTAAAVFVFSMTGVYLIFSDQCLNHHLHEVKRG